MSLPRIKLPFSILLILLIALVAGALSLLGHRMALQANDVAAMQRTLSVSAETLNSIEQLLSSARLVTRLTSRSTLSQQEDLDERLSQLGFIKQALRDSPSISSMFIGYATGDFFMVRVVRDQQHSIALKIHPDTRFIVQSIEHTDIEYSAPGSIKANVRGRFIYFDEELKQISQSYRPDYAKDYDPRVRDWYKNAFRGTELMTSPPYVFFSDRTLGQTMSIKTADGLAVIGADIGLSVLKDILKAKRITPGTHSVIVNDDGFVLAIDHGLVTAATPVISGRAQTSPLINNQQAKSAEQMLTTPPSLTSLREVGVPIFSAMMSTFHERDRGKPILADFSASDLHWRTSISPLNITGGSTFYLLIASPDEELLAGAHEIRQRTLILAVIISLCSLPLGYLLISRPLQILSNDIARMMDFSGQNTAVKSSFIIELSTLGLAINRLRQAILAFTAYVPRELVSDLVKSGEEIKVGGESRYLTIMFTDLKDFSALSESTPSRELLQRVSYYLELMTLAVKQERGTVDKFIGDAVMAFWGAPVVDQNHAYHACVAALKGKRRMVTLNEKLLAEQKTPLSVRIGIHTDAVLVGNIGSLERLSYTVMGDGVNIASRLEGINKSYDTQICVSHSVYKEAGERLWLRPIEKIRVKGRESEFLIYELLGIRDGSPETQASDTEQALCVLTEQAYGLYAKKCYQEALTVYLQLVERFDDSLAKVMVAKCQANVTPEA
ncbi:MAG: hypothetical protein HQ450_15700 [Alcaligenaceae bacterium]|nr:hypothetical protein [Alcaligenaceae bacterium]